MLGAYGCKTVVAGAAPRSRIPFIFLDSNIALSIMMHAVGVLVYRLVTQSTTKTRGCTYSGVDMDGRCYQKRELLTKTSQPVP